MHYVWRHGLAGLEPAGYWLDMAGIYRPVIGPVSASVGARGAQVWFMAVVAALVRLITRFGGSVCSMSRRAWSKSAGWRVQPRWWALNHAAQSQLRSPVRMRSGQVAQM